jgi:hypothetical protein
MKKFFTLFLFVATSTIFAQGPVIEATYYPVRNTSIKQVWDTAYNTIPVPTIGTNMFWDYSTVFNNIADTFSFRMLDPGATPYFSLFPQATHAVFLRTPLKGNPSDSLFEYFKVDYSGLHSIGGYNIQHQYDSTITYNPGEFWAPPLMPYGYTKTDTSRFIAYANHYSGYRGKIKNRKIKTFTYVGYGTLKLPNGTYNNVAQIREVNSEIDSIFIDIANNGNYVYFGPPQTSSSKVYQFYRNNTFGSAYLMYLNVNPANTIVETGWYTLPVDFGSISGTVYTSTTEATPITSGEAYLYRENSNFVKQDILAKAQINAVGNYKFDSIPYGEYRIAIRPNASLYPNAMITYFGDTTNWIDATPIITNTLTSPGHKIHVQFHQAPTGSNAIHGSVMQNLGMARSANAEGMMSSNPIPGVGIVVKRNPGSSTARTVITDANGEYDLGSLEDGGYVLFVDIPGMHMTGTYSFNVSGTASVTGLDYTAGTDSIHPDNLAIGIKELKNSKGGFMSAYPNPYSSQATILLDLKEAGDMTLEVYNLLGEKVSVLDKGVKQQGTYTYNFSAKKLNFGAGIYFVKLTVGNKTDVIKLIEE